jgi:hypothetical protein
MDTLPDFKDFKKSDKINTMNYSHLLERWLFEENEINITTFRNSEGV